ncbi:hypothetical protein Trydic_g9834 [Trypoxylus dichotomus]
MVYIIELQCHILQNKTAQRSKKTEHLLKHAKNLPEKLWAEAVNTAAYVISRNGPSPEDAKSPYELLYNKTPCIDHLRSFGTDCYTDIPKQKRSKFDKEAIKGQVVGYCADKDGYRIWMSENDDIILSRDIIFHEETEINSNVKFVVAEMTEEYTAKIVEQESGEAKLKDNTEKEIANNTATNLRSRDKLKKPAQYTDFAMLAVYEEPARFSEAIASPEPDKWKTVIAEELNALSVNKTWKLVDLPNGKKPIDNRWVFKIKGRSYKGNFRYRTRLVAKGYSQVSGLDYEETFSPVARWDTIRSVLSVTAKENLNIAQFDVKTAFIYTSIEDDLYMSQPEGFDDKSGRVCKLLKESNADLCLFMDSEKRLIIVLHVDDGLVASKENREVVIEPANYFLSLEIHRLNDRYLRVTTKLGILYDSSSDDFTDAEYAGDVSTKHSTCGMIFKYCGGAIA